MNPSTSNALLGRSVGWVGGQGLATRLSMCCEKGRASALHIQPPVLPVIHQHLCTSTAVLQSLSTGCPRVWLCLLQVCAGWRSSNRGDSFLGRCVTATVRFVPSYSTKLACQACDDPWQVSWQVSTAADAWNQQYNWPEDPMWTESDWPESTPDLQLYLHESPAVENGVSVAGFLVTAAVGAASYAARKAFARHHVAWS